MTVRTAQGTIAWIVSLVTFPYVAVPAYWVLGRSRFSGYVVERRRRDFAAEPHARRIAEQLAPLIPGFARSSGAALAGQHLARLPYLGGNEVELLYSSPTLCPPPSPRRRRRRRSCDGCGS